MNLRKIGLLASMALAAMALAIPAGASASGMFYHENETLVGEPTVAFNGNIGFLVHGVGSFECEAEATVILKTNNGTLEDLDIDTETCEGAGALAECSLEDDELTTDANLTPTATTIDLTGLELYNTFDNTVPAECPLPHEVEIKDHAGDIVELVPNNHNAISRVEVTGSIIDWGRVPNTDSAYTPIATATAFGELELTSSLGTYGLTGT